MSEGSRVRLHIVGVVVLALFCALFARLWYLQFAAAESLRSVAVQNQVRMVQDPPIRGRILDRNGWPLAENRVVDAVTVDRKLAPEDRDELVGRLSQVLEVPADEINAKLDDPRISPVAPVPVALDVPIEKITYLEEHTDDFPGVEAKRIAVRTYPNGTTMAHVLGYVGEINDEELERRAEAGYQLGDPIGKGGVEQSYEADLRGAPRVERVEVDSRGQPITSSTDREARPGYDVQLTLDVNVQQVAERALAEGMDAARGRQDDSNKERYTRFAAPAGSVVVLDATDGSVVAMASNPTYDPNEFVGGIPTPTWEYLNDESNHYPLLNRVIQGTYATGSTFKLVTSIAGVESGLRTPATTINDDGEIEFGGQVFKNAGGRSYGAVNLERALTVSSDAYYYLIGLELWQSYQQFGNPAGDAIQDVARRYGYGSTTGVELPSEAVGRVPDAEWVRTVHEENPEAFPDGTWYPGMNIQLAIGQGDMLATPLQLATSYATFLNGGTRFEPRVVSRIVDQPAPDQPARVVREVAPTVATQTNLDPGLRDVMLAGFQGAVATGTAEAAFAGWDMAQYPIAGKTGTAEVQGKSDSSLFVGMTLGFPQYVVAVVVEEAGFGSEVAAPIARRVMEAVYGIQATEPVETVTGSTE